jgi:hypothetical protein
MVAPVSSGANLAHDIRDRIWRQRIAGRILFKSMVHSAVTAQSRKEGGNLPMAVQDTADQAFPAPTATHAPP